MPLVTRSQIISIVEERLKATKQFQRAMGEGPVEEAAEGFAADGRGDDFSFDDEEGAVAAPRIDPTIRARLLTALTPATAAVPNHLTLETINDVVDIFDSITRNLLGQGEDVDAADIENRMSTFAPAGGLRNFIHQQFARDPEAVKVFLKDFLAQADLSSRFSSDLNPGTTGAANALELLTVDSILDEALRVDRRKVDPERSQTIDRSQAKRLAEIARDGLSHHFPDSVSALPPASPESLYPAGLLRNFLHKNCAQFGEEVKVVLQEILVFQDVLSRMNSTVAILDCLEKFPGNVEAGETYGACVQGLKERLESALLGANPLTPSDALVAQAYDESIMDRVKKYYPGGRGPRGEGIDVHSSTVFGWMFGLRQLGHTTYTTHLYDGKGQASLKLDIYRNQHKLIQEKIKETRAVGTQQLRDFFAAHPIMDRGNQAYYAGDGTRCYKVDANSFEAEIEGKRVRITKSPKGGYYYKEQDSTAADGSVIEGKSVYFSAQINNAYRALEELLKRQGLLSPSAEFGPAKANELGLLTSDAAEWKATAAQVAILHFLPDIRIEDPWQNYGEDGHASLMSPTEPSTHLTYHSIHAQRSIIVALRSGNPQEQTAAIHGIYLVYIFKQNVTHNATESAKNIYLQKLLFDLGYSLISPEERIAHLREGGAGMKSKALSRAYNFITDLLAQNEAGIPDFMKDEVRETAALVQEDCRAGRLPHIYNNIDSYNRDLRIMEAVSSLNSSNDWRAFKEISEVESPAAARRDRLRLEEFARANKVEILRGLISIGIIPHQINTAISSGSFTEFELLAWVFNDECVRSGVSRFSQLESECIPYLAGLKLTKPLRFLLVHGPENKREEIARILASDKSLCDLVLSDAIKSGDLGTITQLVPAEKFNVKISTSDALLHPLRLASTAKRNPRSVALLVEIANELSDPSAIAEAKEAATESFRDSLGDLEINLALLKSAHIDLHDCFSQSLSYPEPELAQNVLDRFCNRFGAPDQQMLWIAASYNSTFFVEKLLEANPDLDPYRREDGELSAYDFALNSESTATLEVILRAGEEEYDFDPEARLEKFYELLGGIIDANAPDSIAKAKKLLTAAKRAKIDISEEKLVKILAQTQAGKLNSASLVSLVFDEEARNLKFFEKGQKTRARGVSTEIILHNVPAFFRAALTVKGSPGKTAAIAEDLFLNLLTEVQFSKGGEEDLSLCTNHLNTPSKGWPALHYAISQGVSARTVETLFKLYKPNPNLRTPQGQNALQVALDTTMAAGTPVDLEIVDQLLSITAIGGEGTLRIDCNRKDAHGRVPLYQLMKIHAADNTNNNARKLAEAAVLVHKAKYDLAFEVALQQKDRKTALHILQVVQEKRDVHQEDTLSKMFKIALAQGDTGIVTRLLNEAEPSTKHQWLREPVSETGLNAAHFAIEQNNPNMLSVLLHHDEVDPNSVNQNGETLLTAALRKYATNLDFDFTIPQLLTVGANPFLVNSRGISPLHLALTTIPPTHDIDVAAELFQRAGPWGINLSEYLFGPAGTGLIDKAGTIDTINRDTSLTSDQKTRSLLRLNELIANQYPDLLPSLASRYVCLVDPSATIQNSAALANDVLGKMNSQQKEAFFANKDCETQCTFIDTEGKTRGFQLFRKPALHHAIATANVDMMKVLVVHGADTTMPDSRRRLPLLYAASDSNGLHTSGPILYLIENHLTPQDEEALTAPPGAFYNLVKFNVTCRVAPEDSHPTLHALATAPAVKNLIPTYYKTFLESGEDELTQHCQTINEVLLNGITPGRERDILLSKCCRVGVISKRPDLAAPLLEAIDNERIKKETIRQTLCSALLNYDQVTCEMIIGAADAPTRTDLTKIAYQDVTNSGVDPSSIDRAQILVTILATSIDDIPLPKTKAEKEQLKAESGAASTAVADAPGPAPADPGADRAFVDAAMVLGGARK